MEGAACHGAAAILTRSAASTRSGAVAKLPAAAQRWGGRTRHLASASSPSWLTSPPVMAQRAAVSTVQAMLPTAGAAIQIAENMRPRGSAVYPTICGWEWIERLTAMVSGKAGTA